MDDRQSTRGGGLDTSCSSSPSSLHWVVEKHWGHAELLITHDGYWCLKLSDEVVLVTMLC